MTRDMSEAHAGPAMPRSMDLAHELLYIDRLMRLSMSEIRVMGEQFSSMITDLYAAHLSGAIFELTPESEEFSGPVRGLARHGRKGNWPNSSKVGAVISRFGR